MIAHSRRCADAIRQSIEMQYTCRSNIKQLDLTSHCICSFTYQSSTLLQQLIKLQNLILADCELFTLNSLPYLGGLQQLDLSNNRIPDAQIVHVLKYTNLVRLNISYNCIQKSETVFALKVLRKLKMIDCMCNPLERVEQYQNAILREIAQLRVLNGLQRQGKQYVEAPFYVIKENPRQGKTQNKELALKFKSDSKRQKPQVGQIQIVSWVKNCHMIRRYRDKSVIQIDESDEIPKKRRMI